MVRPIVTKIVSKFQVTVPPEIRTLYGLCEGDLLEWDFNPKTAELSLRPKRAHLLTPQVRADVAARRERAPESVPVPANSTVR